jgi:hypothetical protein
MTWALGCCCVSRPLAASRPEQLGWLVLSESRQQVVAVLHCVCTSREGRLAGLRRRMQHQLLA